MKILRALGTLVACIGVAFFCGLLIGSCRYEYLLMVR